VQFAGDHLERLSIYKEVLISQGELMFRLSFGQVAPQQNGDYQKKNK
jgi:hypothetical protein